MQYAEVLPSQSLRPFVRCLWFLQSAGGAVAASAGDAVEQVLPDGCAEIVLNRSAAFRRYQAGGSHLQARVLLVSTLSDPHGGSEKVERFDLAR